MKKNNNPVFREIKLFFLTLIIWNADWTCIIHEENECYCNALAAPPASARMVKTDTRLDKEGGHHQWSPEAVDAMPSRDWEGKKKREGKTQMPKAASHYPYPFFSSLLFVLRPHPLSSFCERGPPPTPRWVPPVCRCAESCHQALIDARLAENIFVCCPQLGKHPPKWKLIQNLISLSWYLVKVAALDRFFFFFYAKTEHLCVLLCN